MNFVQIAGWSQPRAIAVRSSERRLVLQVKLFACRNCSACESRYRELSERFTARGVEARWENGGETVSLPIPPAETPAEKLAFLQDLLGRPVRFMQLAPA